MQYCGDGFVAVYEPGSDEITIKADHANVLDLHHLLERFVNNVVINKARSVDIQKPPEFCTA